MVKQSIKANVRKRHSEMKAAQKLEAEEREKQKFFKIMKRGRSLRRQLRALEEIIEPLRAELNDWNDQYWSLETCISADWREELEAILEIEDEEQA